MRVSLSSTPFVRFGQQAKPPELIAKTQYLEVVTPEEETPATKTMTPFQIVEIMGGVFRSIWQKKDKPAEVVAGLKFVQAEAAEATDEEGAAPKPTFLEKCTATILDTLKISAFKFWWLIKQNSSKFLNEFTSVFTGKKPEASTEQQQGA